MSLPATGTVIDLRPDDLRTAQPLGPLTTLPVVPVTLDAIEQGTHSLATLTAPLVVVCERGVRSGLAARYLRADGLDAQAYPGGVPALLREVSP
ncbi:rhodanese-like domain-containing protein [Deinococcus yunweiensis]|uniref:rhodanese-like domain-containing protein n=1 Tax=Deinococcus yunweiensis TaxID=367282 RepID=UPI00398E74D9